jgi:glycosyltransferase involved in cell wall biosynthesis
VTERTDLRPRVVMGCPHHWRSPFQVAGQHFARAFVDAGWDVAYISNPISPWHLLDGLSDDLRRRLRLYRAGGLRDLDDHLLTYVPGAVVTPHRAPLLRSRWVHRNWQRASIPNIVSWVRGHGFESPDLLYLDSVVQGFWLDAYPGVRSVLRVGDRMTAFGGFTGEMQEMQREMAARVDLVIYSARQLEDDVRSLEPRRMQFVPNGVDVSHFAADTNQPEDLTSVPRPIALYIGAMDVWFDFELVDAMAAALPDVSFVLIGPADLARRSLHDRPNIHILGPRPYSQISGYMHHADVGLIPFDVQRHGDLVNGIHPLKLYEYFAAGLPVVATAWAELVELGSPALLCRSVEDHVQAIRQALSGDADRAASLEFAAAADWKQRLQDVLTGVPAAGVGSASPRSFSS